MGRTPKNRPTADEALQLLLEGNRRFVAGNLEHPNHCKESRRLSSSGQEPFATILTCADSRVPPVDIFDQGIGDLFVVRVAGNIIGFHTLGSIEYAVQHLNTPLVMVMGHSCCGAVGAVASGVRLDGHMSSFTAPIQTAIKKVKDLEGDLVDNAAKEVAKMIASQISVSEPILADFVNDNKVKVVAAYYDISTGTVILL
ncbi:carbonic anhydrase [Desulfopila inferna]|uniref:carbonic anhydrase n=1 Tax=Desulfopila inferna TaxID=468528 RepID=UPI001962D4B7|nr:carbonic anhydrase [Desulfopila inferna]MBM9605129.1 carbonic anhydrase [Desulfopila inferna]